MIESWLTFAAGRTAELWVRTGEHLVLTGLSTAGAILLGVPLGVLASKVRTIRNPLMGTVGIFQTIPSLAMLAILLALTKQIGIVPAIIALTLYALLPIVRNTLTGIEQVPPSSLEAARGLGMTLWQTLILVEVPLALPMIIAGVRTAAVVGVGIATLSAFIGAGGLGEFINRGLALSNTQLILLGAIPAALLALIVDGSIGAFQWAVQRRHGRSPLEAIVRWVVRPAALVLPLIISGIGVYAALASRQENADDVVRIASKSFTEQLILGEIVAQTIEHHTDRTVERRFNLGGTMICHEALIAGEVDIYPEYVGTALTAILQLDGTRSAGDALETVRNTYTERFGCIWFDPLGFENTYVLALRKEVALREQLTTISGLASVSNSMRAGFPSEFMERPDGYPGLRRTYGLSFANVRDLDPALMYQALVSGELDVISAFSTDGRIEAYDLALLKDDRSFFPPYQAALVVREDLIAEMPELGPLLRRLTGMIDTETMQQMNYQVDHHQHSPREVARQFLESMGLVKENG